MLERKAVHIIDSELINIADSHQPNNLSGLHGHSAVGYGREEDGDGWHANPHPFNRCICSQERSLAKQPTTVRCNGYS